jgi:hypothetical protein
MVLIGRMGKSPLAFPAQVIHLWCCSRGRCSCRSPGSGRYLCRCSAWSRGRRISRRCRAGGGGRMGGRRGEGCRLRGRVSNGRRRSFRGRRRPGGCGRVGGCCRPGGRVGGGCGWSTCCRLGRRRCDSRRSHRQGDETQHVAWHAQANDGYREAIYRLPPLRKAAPPTAH